MIMFSELISKFKRSLGVASSFKFKTKFYFFDHLRVSQNMATDSLQIIFLTAVINEYLCHCTVDFFKISMIVVLYLLFELPWVVLL